jgi:hypothetical protein
MEEEKGGGIAATHSWPRHYMGASGQRHAPAALLPPGKWPPVPIVQEAGRAPEPVWTQRLEEKSFCLCRESNLGRPAVQPVARHYTDLAAPAPSKKQSKAVPLHAKVALGGRGGIHPTHSWPRH